MLIAWDKASKEGDYTCKIYGEIDIFGNWHIKKVKRYKKGVKMKNKFELSKELWCKIHKTPYCPDIGCKEFWGCKTVEAERRAKLKKIEENKIKEEAKKRKDFDEMCEVNYNKIFKKLMEDPLIKEIIKKLNEKKLKKLKYFETKVVKVKKVDRKLIKGNSNPQIAGENVNMPETAEGG